MILARNEIIFETTVKWKWSSHVPTVHYSLRTNYKMVFLYILVSVFCDYFFHVYNSFLLEEYLRLSSYIFGALTSVSWHRVWYTVNMVCSYWWLVFICFVQWIFSCTLYSALHWGLNYSSVIYYFHFLFFQFASSCEVFYIFFYSILIWYLFSHPWSLLCFSNSELSFFSVYDLSNSLICIMNILPVFPTIKENNTSEKKNSLKH